MTPRTLFYTTASVLLVAASVTPLNAQHATYSGTGDDVVQIDKPEDDRPALLVIQGNRQGRHFAVVGHTQNRQRTGALVNTTEPYSGIVPVDLPPNQNTALLEVSATGAWDIKVYPIGAARKVDVPSSFNGDGDQVLWLEGDATTARITGNQTEHHFAVIAYDNYGNRLRALVNTTDSYNGTVMMPANVLLLEISTNGTWTIQLE